jgi:hypothetical protein
LLFWFGFFLSVCFGFCTETKTAPGFVKGNKANPDQLIAFSQQAIPALVP